MDTFTEVFEKQKILNLLKKNVSKFRIEYFIINQVSHNHHFVFYTNEIDALKAL